MGGPARRPVPAVPTVAGPRALTAVAVLSALMGIGFFVLTFMSGAALAQAVGVAEEATATVTAKELETYTEGCDSYRFDEARRRSYLGRDTPTSRRPARGRRPGRDRGTSRGRRGPPRARRAGCSWAWPAWRWGWASSTWGWRRPGATGGSWPAPRPAYACPGARPGHPQRPPRGAGHPRDDRSEPGPAAGQADAARCGRPGRGLVEPTVVADPSTGRPLGRRVPRRPARLHPRLAATVRPLRQV